MRTTPYKQPSITPIEQASPEVCLYERLCESSGAPAWSLKPTVPGAPFTFRITHEVFEHKMDAELEHEWVIFGMLMLTVRAPMKGCLPLTLKERRAATKAANDASLAWLLVTEGVCSSEAEALEEIAYYNAAARLNLEAA